MSDDAVTFHPTCPACGHDSITIDDAEDDLISEGETFNCENCGVALVTRLWGPSPQRPDGGMTVEVVTDEDDE